MQDGVPKQVPKQQNPPTQPGGGALSGIYPISRTVLVGAPDNWKSFEWIGKAF